MNARKRYQIPVLPLLFAAAVIFARTALHACLYHDGFVALTADDFARTLQAHRWAQFHYIPLYGPWLPYFALLNGLLLKVIHNMIWTPRVLSIFAGLLSLFPMYKLTDRLFNDKQASALAAFMMSFSYIHIWLSSVPLTEIYQIMFLLFFLWQFVTFQKSSETRNLLYASISLLLANGFRFEAWMISALFSSFIFISGLVQLRRGKLTFRRFAVRFLVVCIPWIFPLLWILSNYLQTGDPFYFMTFIREYKGRWYGDSLSYMNYFITFWELDPFLVYVVLPAILLVIFKFRKLAQTWGYLFIVLAGLMIYLVLSGGQVEPPGNYLRYFALFVMLMYPMAAFLIISLARVIPFRIVSMLVMVTFAAWFALWHVERVFQYQNDPSATQLPVGREILRLASETPAVSGTFLVELRRWDCVAIEVGSRDSSSILFDRKQDSLHGSGEPILEMDNETVTRFLVDHNVRQVVLRTPALRERFETMFACMPRQTVGDYAFYDVSEFVFRKKSGLLTEKELSTVLEKFERSRVLQITEGPWIGKWTRQSENSDVFDGVWTHSRTGKQVRGTLVLEIYNGVQVRIFRKELGMYYHGVISEHDREPLATGSADWYELPTWKWELRIVR